MILRARTVLPVTAPPIENGAVVVSGNRITAIGAWKEISRHSANRRCTDLGDAVLLPGLINAHCHLDYTDMAGQLPPPKTFLDWIPQMLAAKAAWSYTDYARSWINGAKMLLQTGTTTVADIEAVPELLPEMWEATPLRIFSFLEMTGVRSKREPKEILGDALAKINSLSHSRSRAALSPHAPYSTSPELLRLCGETARKRNLRIATHLAESEQEFATFIGARGNMFDWLQKNGRDMADCGFNSPVAHLHRTGLLDENLLAIHVNCLATGDAELLGNNRVNIVHCPRSHDYFRNPPFPRKELTHSGANICLGTDSLATVRKHGNEKPALNMFSEMQLLASKNKSLPREEILKMATINGARALGLSGKIGELSENAFADLMAIPFRGKVADIFDAVVHHASTISAVMVDGKWAIAP
ncbi:MAG TPA: amidohydrolase family protein [Verrucomicrobiae bacterium]|nr:amidohydrolase family protein [Verrucomicrobiae bacterium]